MKKSGKYLTNKNAVKVIIAVLAVMAVTVFFFEIDFLTTVIGVVLIIITLTVNSLVGVDTVVGGIPTRFGERIKNKNKEVRILEEGIHLVFPLIDTLEQEEIFEKKLTTTEVTTQATLKDKLTIKMKGSVQYRPHNLNVYVEMAEKTIEEGMIDTVEDEFGSICGMKNADDFYQNRAKVALLIDCMFRLERAPHYYLNEANFLVLSSIKKEFGEEPSPVAGQVMGVILSQKDAERYEKKGGDKQKLKNIREKLNPNRWILKEEKDAEGNELGEIDLIAFYNDNITRINLLFDLSELVPKERLSPTEKLYGIKVARFRMALVEFSEDVQRAFEEERSAKAQMKAADARFETKERLIKGYIAAGLSPEVAVNLVESTTNEKTTRQVISVEGKGGNSDLLSFAHLMRGGSPQSPASSAPKKPEEKTIEQHLKENDEFFDSIE